MRAIWRRLRKHRSGAVAPTVALSLFALVGMGGIAFDYAHLADLDTELQQAADQAALAAATQLDGSIGARGRATAAAQSLLSNTTFFASDDSDDDNARKVTIATVNFYQSYDDTADTYGDPATKDSDARIVQVVVGGRTANYALTPVVGALSSGTISAEAVASLAAAVCNVPPLMMCAPAGTSFPSSGDIGIGVLLQPGPKIGSWAPGDYGYLDFSNGASGLATNLGKNNEVGGCTDNSNGIPSEPGNKSSVTSALNSRFDLYPAGASTCTSGNGDFCPAENTGKDLIKTEEVTITVETGAAQPANPGCGQSGAKMLNASNSTDTNGFVQGTVARGLPRDNCHIANNCSGNNFGNGAWDRATYFGSAHPSDSVSTVASSLGKTSTTLTRYDVYKWELASKSVRLATKQTDITPSPVPMKVKGPNTEYTFTNQCTYPHPVNGAGVTSGTNQKDRRVLTVAAVDCTGLNGKGNVIVEQWVDILLVEPSLTRTVPYATGQEQIYGEIIGIAKRPNGQSAFQYYLRQRPRLLR